MEETENKIKTRNRSSLSDEAAPVSYTWKCLC